jgi:hypothetical protein
MRQAEPPQHPPNGAAMNLDAMRLGQFRCQLVERDFSLGHDARLDPAGHAGQFPVAAAVALRPRLQRPGFPAQLDQIIHEPRRHPEVARRFAMPVTLIDKRDDALA